MSSYILVSFLMIITYSYFIHAGIFYFQSQESKDRSNAMKAISLFGLCYIILLVGLQLAARRYSIHQYTASFLFITSIFLLRSSIRAHRHHALDFAFSNRSPKHLTMTGPYRWIRHPIYASYLVGWIAGVLTTGKLTMLIPLFIMASFYWSAIREEEKCFSKSDLAQHYHEYSKKTYRIIPFIF